MTGRQRRRQYEYQQLQRLDDGRNDIDITVTRQDADGIPCGYLVSYHIRSICGINEEDLAPVFADEFLMAIDIPDDYPQVDAPPHFHFIESHPASDGDHPSVVENHPANGRHYPLPWHPNIRYYGDMAGHVCINQLNTFTDISWGVERVALYLRYELYHALLEAPYPEDLKVAEWVRHVGEPKEYIFFDQSVKG